MSAVPWISSPHLCPKWRMIACICLHRYSHMEEHLRKLEKSYICLVSSIFGWNGALEVSSAITDGCFIQVRHQHRDRFPHTSNADSISAKLHFLFILAVYPWLYDHWMSLSQCSMSKRFWLLEELSCILSINHQIAFILKFEIIYLWALAQIWQLAQRFFCI